MGYFTVKYKEVEMIISKNVITIIKLVKPNLSIK